MLWQDSASHHHLNLSVVRGRGVVTGQVCICICIYFCLYLQGESKKSGISKIMGITSLKYIRKGHIGGVLENSGYLLPDGH